MICIGIDPGASGAIAVLDGDRVTAMKLADMTERDIYDCLSDLAGTGTVAVIEQVHSMPGQGVSSTFKLGVSYGGLRMALVAAGIRFQPVTPVRWQTALSCRSGGNKNVTKAKAQELFPAIKITHAIADALLLAEYCRRTS